MRVVLVTGGAGFIGSHVSEYLLSAGYDVGILDDFSTGRLENLKPFAERLKIHRGSITDRKLVRSALDGVDAVILNAAFLGVERVLENPWKVLETNCGGAHVLFSEVVRSRAKKVIFASSSEVYDGLNTFPLKEDVPLIIDRPYPMSKRLGEVYCKAINDQFGIDSCSLRYFNVYGPKQGSRNYGFVVSTFLERVMSNRPLKVFGSGSQTRDFTYVSDVALANQLALEKKTKGEILNIGSGVETSINELAETVIKITGSKVGVRHVAPRTYDTKRRVADVEKAKRILKWRAQTALDTGLEHLWEWFRTGFSREARK